DDLCCPIAALQVSHDGRSPARFVTRAAPWKCAMSWDPEDPASLWRTCPKWDTRNRRELAIPSENSQARIQIGNHNPNVNSVSVKCRPCGNDRSTAGTGKTPWRDTRQVFGSEHLNKRNCPSRQVRKQGKTGDTLPGVLSNSTCPSIGTPGRFFCAAY